MKARAWVTGKNNIHIQISRACDNPEWHFGTMYPLQQLLDPPLPPVSMILPTESLIHKKPFGSSRCLVAALG